MRWLILIAVLCFVVGCGKEERKTFGTVGGAITTNPSKQP